MAPGANCVLSQEISRQRARDPAKVEAAAQALCDDGLEVAGHALDITRDDRAAVSAMWAKQTCGAFDVLANNHGILLERIYGDAENTETDVLDVEIDVVKQALDANLLGPLRVTQHLAPLLRSGGWVVNRSSQMGPLAWANGNIGGLSLAQDSLQWPHC